MSGVAAENIDHKEPVLNKRRVRIAVSLVYFSMGLCFSSWASRIPEIKTALHLNDALFGTILLAIPVLWLTTSFRGLAVRDSCRSAV